MALAKLGDFLGIAILRQSLKNGDLLRVVDDFVQIGLKRFIPELLPMLADRDVAAQAILVLLERGK